MANERAFKGTFTLDDAPGAGANDFAPHYIDGSLTFQRDGVQVAAKLSTDRRYQIPGVQFDTFSARFGSLTSALMDVLHTAYSAATLLRVVFRPLTGAASATNPQITVDFYLLSAPAPPMSLTEEYVFELPAVEVVASSWTDGTNTHTYGTLAV